MFYEYDLTVPANTPAASPAELTAVLNVGTITRVEIQFPPGCNGMVSVAVDHWGRQLWPGDPDEDIAGGGSIVAWEEDFDLEDEPYELTLRGWSPGTTYQHVITFRFALLPLEVARGRRDSGSLIGRLAGMLLGRR